MKKFRVSLTLTSEQAEVFEKLAKKKYGNNHYHRSRLLRLAVEAILGSGGKVVFATQGSRNLSTFKTPRNPANGENNGGVLSTNSQFRDKERAFKRRFKGS